MFAGSFVALTTPFKDGQIDDTAFRSFIEWQITEGSDGLVPCGTTGESPTLSHEEHQKVTEICIEVTDGRIPVIAGAGSNSTEEAISLAQHAKTAGADAVLVNTAIAQSPDPESMGEAFKLGVLAGRKAYLAGRIPSRSTAVSSSPGAGAN